MCLSSKQYEYTGPVMSFDNCIEQYWTARTWASSKRKALSNLAYRYKIQHNMVSSSKITLPGKINEVAKGE